MLRQWLDQLTLRCNLLITSGTLRIGVASAPSVEAFTERQAARAATTAFFPQGSLSVVVALDAVPISYSTLTHSAGRAECPPVAPL